MGPSATPLLTARQRGLVPARVCKRCYILSLSDRCCGVVVVVVVVVGCGVVVGVWVVVVGFI